jgi:hypothetical protein
MEALLLRRQSVQIATLVVKIAKGLLFMALPINRCRKKKEMRVPMSNGRIR